MALFRRVKPPFSLKTLQKDPNCLAIEAPWEVWGAQDFLPRRNLLTYSEDFSNAAWTKTASSISGQKLIADATTAAHRIERVQSSIASISNGVTATLTVEAKAAEYNWIMLYLGTVGAGKYFNVSNGSIGSNYIGAPISATSEAIDNGYYRVKISFTTQSLFDIRIHVTNADNVSSFLGDGTSGVYVRNVMLTRADTIDQSYQKISDFVTEQYEWAAQKNVPWLRRNMHLYTEDLSGTGWTRNGVNVTTSGIIPPSGYTVASKITHTGATGEVLTNPNNLTYVSGYTYSVQFVLKYFDTTWVRPVVSLGTPNLTLWVNLQNGTLGAGVVQSTPGIADNITQTITDIGGGYYKVVLVFRALISGTTGYTQLNTASGDASGTRVAGSFIATGIQVAVSAVDVPYQANLSTWDATYTANAIAAGYPISLWHDAAGTIAAWESGRAIGAVRDLKYGDYGQNLITNPGPFVNTNDISAVNTAVLSIVSGKLRVNNTTASGSAAAVFAINTTTGRYYKVDCSCVYGNNRYYVTKSDSGSVFSQNRVDVVALSSTDQVATKFFTATADVTYIWFFLYDSVSSTYSDLVSLSVREIPGYTAIQSTTANQPKWVLDSNGKALFRRDGVNDALPVTFPNLGTDCEVFVGTGPTVSEAVDQTINGSYAPLTPTDDYGRVIFQTTPKYRSKLIKWLLAKAGY